MKNRLTALGTRVPRGDTLVNYLENRDTNHAALTEPSAADLNRTRTSKLRLDQLVLSTRVREQLSTLLSRIRNHDLLYGEWELDRIDPHGGNKVVCLYGPSGTGKTSCAEALAGELGMPVLEVNYAELESKYVGETARNLQRLFETARSEAAVLFFDEADSMFGSRLSSPRHAADQAVNVNRAVLLRELDRFDGVVVLATNLLPNFDLAFRRRILAHIEVPLPDQDARTELWQRMLSPRIPGRDQLNWQQLAEESDGLSGADIKNAAVLALAELANVAPDERRLTESALLRAVEAFFAARA